MRKKFLVLTMAAVLAFSAVACGDKKEDKTEEVTTVATTEEVTTETEADTEAEVASSNEAKEEHADVFTNAPVDPVNDKQAKDAYNATYEVKYENLSFQLPDYIASQEPTKYGTYDYYIAEQSTTGYAMFAFDVESLYFNPSELTVAEKTMLIDSMEASGSMKVKNASMTTIAGYEALELDIDSPSEDENTSQYGRFYMIFDTDANKMIVIAVLESNNSEYEYMADFEKIIASAKVVK